MSMTRTIKRNIARENMTKQGIKHSHSKGYAVDPKNETKISKAFKRTLTSLFALNWRKFLPGAAKHLQSRESRKPFFARKPKEA